MPLMNRIFILATIILLASCKTSTITINNTSELKEITLNEIWNGTFSPERMNALNEANKQFDMFCKPDRIHGIYKGKNTRLNVDSKMTNFIETHLIN